MDIFKFKFNWNVVADICPEYRKYLINYAEDRTLEEVGETAPVRRLPVNNNSTEEELDIIAEVHSKEDSIDRVIPHRDFQQIHMPARRNDPCWDIHPLYDASHSRVTKMNPLQLMPPKAILDVGSYMTFPGRKGWDLQYSIRGDKNSNQAVNLHKAHIAERGDKISMIRASYWFDQRRYITSDMSGEFKSLIYNKRTHCLYYLFRAPKKITSNKKAIRYVSKLRGMLWDQDQYQHATSMYSIEMLTSFVNLVEEAVLKDIPDAFVPKLHQIERLSTSSTMGIDDFMRYKLAVLVIQHKVGARLDWITPNVYDNVSTLMMANYDLMLDDLIDAYDNSVCRACRKKQVAKIVPTLRKTRSLKQLLKALLGKDYSNLYLELVKYMGDVPMQYWRSFFKIRRSNHMPKYVYHWAMSLLKNPMPDTSQIIHQIMSALRSLENCNGPQSVHNYHVALESWVKLCKRFNKEGILTPSWYTWRDMYRMASELNIRIRPKKFKTSDEVQVLHDRMSGIIERDKKLVRKYRKTIFKAFESPDKMYGKFKFTQLRTAAALRDEGKSMHHCVGSYADRCAEGYSIIFSMHTPEHSYVTIELNGKSLQYDILQKYTIHDHTVTNDEILALIDEWHKDVLKIHEEDEATYYQLSQLNFIREEDDPFCNGVGVTPAELEADLNGARPRMDTAAELERIQQTIRQLQQRTEAGEGRTPEETMGRLERLAGLVRQAQAHGA